MGHKRSVRIRCDRSARGDEPVREYIGAPPTRERDEWDEALTLLGLFGLDPPVSLRQLDGKTLGDSGGASPGRVPHVSGPEMVLLHAFQEAGAADSSQRSGPRHRRARDVLGGFR
jgi:hypothetical protein